MSNSELLSTRRSFVASVTALGSAWLIHDWAALESALDHAARAVGQQPPPQFTTLSAEEGAVIGAMTERIIPTDSTPGAREAGAVHFIDRALGTIYKDQLSVVRKGVRDLNARVAKRHREVRSFAQLDPTAQDAMLREIENTPFFQGTRFATIVGTFANSSWGGNRDNIGWKLLGFEPHAIHRAPFGYYDAQAAERGR